MKLCLRAYVQCTDADQIAHPEQFPSGTFLSADTLYNVQCFRMKSLRKRAFSNILKILQPKKENFQIKNTEVLHISSQSIDCGYSLEPPRRGGSNEYPQSMFF